MHGNINNSRYKHKNDTEGKVTLDKSNVKNSKSENLGEYVDFEEIEE